MGSPGEPTREQYRQLEQAGQLALLEAPSAAGVRDGRFTRPFSLPRRAVSLLVVEWR
jgi:hypothetical protein